MNVPLQHEASWWGDCSNTFHEEQKQIVYAREMGMALDWSVGHPPAIMAYGASIIDIGGGPVSLLLKTRGAEARAVWDPILKSNLLPGWVHSRYLSSGIQYFGNRGEDLDRFAATYDEAWIYNVLQHVEDPERVVRNAIACSTRLRIFDWLHAPTDQMHPHELRAHELRSWIGTTEGRVIDVEENGAVGTAFVGVFGT